MGGVSLPLVEPLIALSVLLLCTRIDTACPTAAAIMIVGLFVLFHEHVHGSELPETASSYLHLLGITLACIALHLTNLTIGLAFKRHTWLLRSSGAVIAGIGVWMIAGL